MKCFFFSFVWFSVECRKSVNAANESIETLCQQLAAEKQQYESVAQQLNQLQVTLNHYFKCWVPSGSPVFLVWQECSKQYIDGVNKIQSIASSLQSCSTSAEVIVKEEAVNVKMSADMADADEPN